MSALKSYRTKNQLTQEALAEIIGVTQGFIAHVETGRRRVSAQMAKDWEQKLDGQLTRAQLRPDLYEDPNQTAA